MLPHCFTCILCIQDASASNRRQVYNLDGFLREVWTNIDVSDYNGGVYGVEALQVIIETRNYHMIGMDFTIKHCIIVP